MLVLRWSDEETGRRGTVDVGLAAKAPVVGITRVQASPNFHQHRGRSILRREDTSYSDYILQPFCAETDLMVLSKRTALQSLLIGLPWTPKIAATICYSDLSYHETLIPIL
jgi:hypothetical protein